MIIKPDFTRPMGIELLNQCSDKIETSDNLTEALAHLEVLTGLRKHFSPIDFLAKTFEDYEKLLIEYESKDLSKEEKEDLRGKMGKYKLQEKHYYIATIQEINDVAIENNWAIVEHNECIYLYNGSFWGRIEDQNFKLFLGQVAAKLGVPKIINNHYAFRDHLMKQFKAIQIFATPEIDNDKIHINLKDCTLQIENGIVTKIPKDKYLFITYELPYNYMPDATCVKFLIFLNQVVPDISTQNLLAEYIGYLFIRNGSKSIKAEKILILFGSGANGKSVFGEIIKALLGVFNVSAYSLQQLTAEKGYHRAEIENKLLNLGTEIGSKLDADTLKKLASGESIEAERKYKNPYIMDNYAKLIFNCNQLPKDVEHSVAYFRRFLIVPFNVTIPEEKQDKELINKIVSTELPGILNWALSGLNRLLSQGKFTISKESQETLNRYKIDTDPVLLFLEELNIVKSNDNYYTLKALFDAYNEFSSENRFKSITKQTFKGRLIANGFVVTRRSTGQVVFAKGEINFK